MKVTVSSHLMSWATTPFRQSTVILFGAKGSGKTITSQILTHDLRAMDRSKAPWRPHYFSLKHCVFTGDSLPTLEEILTESIRRHWISDGDLPTGKMILEGAKREPTLFIIDEFDWLADRYPFNGDEQRTLMFELLKLVPIQIAWDRWKASFAAADTKVLLTLRPEYKLLLGDLVAEELLLDPL